MPMVMKDADWMRAVANASRAGGVWFQDVSSHSGTIPLEVPEAGDYQVILVKDGAAAKQGRLEKKKIPVKSISGASGPMLRISSAMVRGFIRRARPRNG